MAIALQLRLITCSIPDQPAGAAAAGGRIRVRLPAVARFLSVLFAGAVAFAQSPPAGVSILAKPALDCFEMTGPATVSRVAVDAPGFDRAWSLVTPPYSGAFYDIRMRCWDTLPVAKGDLLVATFWMRTVSTAVGRGLAAVVMEKGAPPWTKSVMRTVTAGSDWTRHQIAFRSSEDYSAPGAEGRTLWRPDTYNLGIWLTFPPQEIQIGGFDIRNYGPIANPADLGVDLRPYEGHEPDAAWRREAAERIERIRKADLTVAVTGPDGAPLTDAAVRVRQKRHEFLFGAAVKALALVLDNEAGAKYREIFLKSFNGAVFENDLKWLDWEAGSPALVAPALWWLRDNGIRHVRGHNLIWPSRGNLPQDVREMLDAKVVDKAKLRQRIRNHIADWTAALSPFLTEIDVVNEPVTNRDLMDALGEDEIAEWFRLARAGAPAAKLFLNDFGIVESNGYSLLHQRTLLDSIIPRVNASAPVDGIGIQSHFSVDMTPPARLWEIFEEFAKTGKDLKVTEFTVTTEDDALQADYMRDYLTVAFSHPSISGFVHWGFFAGAHWSPAGALIRADWTPRPAYDRWMDMVYRQWWTDVTARTDASGTWRGRGFLGEYEIEVTHRGRTVRQTVPLTARGAAVTVKLPE